MSNITAPSVTDMVSVSIEEAGTDLACGLGENLLDACLKAGVAMPYNCRSGECGECRVLLRSGRVRERPGADPTIFSDADRAAGFILACMCYPDSDVALSVELRQAEGAAVGTTTAVIERVERFTPTIFGVTLRTERELPFSPGQYFDWLTDSAGSGRSFSAANRPGGTHIDFHVRCYPGSRIGSALAEGRLAEGSALQLMGPFGHFGLTAEDWRPAVVVAGGTGLAPIRAMIQAAIAAKRKRNITFFYGARSREELYCAAEIEDWARALPRFKFLPVLSEEPDSSDWTGLRGRVDQAIGQQFHDGFGAEAYLCGPPPMIDAAIPVLRSSGIEDSDIHFDKFTPAK